MYLVFLIICLIIVLLTLEYYIISGFHACSHRLLPLVLALFALYDFYLIVEALTKDHATIDILKLLLLIQFLDVILYYILDVIKIKLSLLQNGIIISLLIGMDILIFDQVGSPGLYHMFVMGFVAISVIGLLILMIKRAPKSEQVSKQIKRNNRILMAAFFIPAITLLLSIFGLPYSSVFLPLSINISCIILFILFVTDRLREVDSVLKEEHFQMLEIPAFLFDTDFFFLDASKKAKEEFSDLISEIETSQKEYNLQEKLQEILNSNGVVYRKINDIFYRCELREAKYKGKKKGYILTYTDITEQKKEADMAKDIARQKSEFLASMSHDLRSPLHAIIGSSEIVLSRGEMSSRTKTMINHIHEAGNNLLDIVNSILDFSKLESGNFQLYPHEYNFKSIVQEQASLAYANLKDKDVIFSVEVINPYPERLFGDEIRVRQLIQNLISNAIKFTDKGYIKCKFDIQIQNENCVRIVYSVEDSGCGMTQAQIRDVFSDYVTFAGESRKEGTGLGLSIVKKLSEMMGGNAKAESDGKNGSTITIEFNQQLVEEDISFMRRSGIALMEPFVILSENDIDMMKVWKNDAIPNYVYPKANVLIADDMMVNTEIFKELAKPWRVHIDTAGNGLEAVEMVMNKHYDLIFLDQMMPVMNGTEAADEMRKNDINVPKILLTADITERMKNLSKVHGFDDFMHKPIDIALLRNNLEKYLPKSLREEYDKEQDDYEIIGTSKEDWYGKALEIYVEEMSELYELLPQYMENDLSMFRNKVHGIKGVSRQLGREALALMAEAMEMAAVTEHIDFIRKTFDMFYGELDHVIQSSKQELEGIGHNEEELSELSVDEVAILLFDLQNAFEEYEMTEIEDIIRKLESNSLDEKLSEVIKKIKYLYEDMEYEDALAELIEYQKSIVE